MTPNVKKAVYMVAVILVVGAAYLLGTQKQQANLNDQHSHQVATTTDVAPSSKTLEDVQAKGHVQCGVSQGLPGFSNPDSAGNWTGIDVDVCRAVAAAIFGDADKVKYSPLSAKERFTALQSGEIDVLSRNTTWTLTRDSAFGLDFAGVHYYDGQGFMVPKDCLLYQSDAADAPTSVSRRWPRVVTTTRTNT